MASTVDYSRLNDIYRQAKPPATKVERGERLDLFPARIVHYCEPPLRSAEVHGLLPPMYILGWYYTMDGFAERFGQGDALNVFEARVLGPFHEKYEDGMPGPFLDSRSTDNYCIVFIASNSSLSALDLPDKEKVIEAVKAILREDRNPEWIRIPVSQ
ncbi:hypothetical protein K523DRAFT_412892 [Schizophyllum commune Tattone D]|nr:hypothetical protein K523DRAFT_412892 [Schizophyllum commune Tattone D]